MADIVDDIRSRLGIYELVSQYVQLKKAGRNFKGLCPFHSEKTPSFIVSPEKQICHCFGCGKGGDVFGFIMNYEGATFPEALQILADKAGVKIENVSKFYKKEAKSEKDEYFKAHDLAADFFEKQLHDTTTGKKMLEYLYGRGVKDETIREFKIGYAPDAYDQLTPFLLKKGISQKVLLKSGLSSSKTIASDDIYDKFRGRLMFPIFDYFGRICGFGGRAMIKDQVPKYLNSPENPIYEKGKLLYGLSHSKQQVKEQNSLILVEGYFDVIMPYQSGVKNIAATSGTALTIDQVKLIKRITSNVVSCFDTDKAGFEAGKRAYVLLGQADINVKAIDGLNSKDPADYVLQKGADFMKLVKEAKDFMSFYIDRLLKEEDVSAYEGRMKVLKELLPFYKQMSSSSKDFYVRELANKLNIEEKSLYDEIERFALPMDHPAREAAAQVSVKKITLMEIFLSIVLEYPALFASIKDRVEESDFSGEMKDIYNELSGQYNSARTDFSRWDFEREILAKNKEKIDVLLLYAEQSYGEFSEAALEIELVKLIDRERKDRKIGRLNEIQKSIAEAEKAQDSAKIKTLLNEYQELSRS